MKVRFYGFSVDISGGISRKDVITHIKSNGHKFSQGGFSRFLYIKDSADTNFYIGVVVTEKSRKQLVTRDPKLKTINRERLKNNETDINYFIISKKNGVGLYQHYHNSTSLRFFEDAMYGVARKLRDSKTDKLIKAQKLSVESDDARKIRKAHKIEFKFRQLVDSSNLKDVLDQYRRIKSYKVTLESLTQEIRDSAPCGEDVVRKHEKYIYDKSSVVTSVSTAIHKHVSENDIRNGIVTVEDDYNEERQIKVLGNLTNFGEMDYDDFIQDIDGRKEDDVVGNPVVDRLLTVAKNDPDARFTSRKK